MKIVKMPKRKKKLDDVVLYCKKNGITYSQYQQAESLKRKEILINE